MDINKYVEEQLKRVDISEIVVMEVRKAINNDIQREIAKCVKNKINELIQIEYDIILNTSIETNDGWGNTGKYASFEELFKQEFRRMLDKSYDMKKSIQKLTENRIEKIFKENYKDAINKVVAELTKK